MAPAYSKKAKPSRFPVARIKKIMQLDEEVGKLASATPVMISKSLECFMQLLIDETAKETRSRGGKKMSAYHLKQTINTHETLDFLRPLVSTISDPAPNQSTEQGNGGPSKPRKTPTTTSTSIPTDAPKRGRKRKSDGGGGSKGIKNSGSTSPPTLPPPPGGSGGGKLPEIGTWKREFEGGGGSGEGGRGLFDDYDAEDDDDDY
ncbi:histone-fold-containing protein [Naematelia encephala]|uniref:Histone-fold-containing protein n=1 Tax=Naematelia encephala TaxID=71784 RepID=A0A1Y2BKU2_9TREE|nr:histone-fold-containing protein [Naematelia encephala]